MSAQHSKIISLTHKEEQNSWSLRLCSVRSQGGYSYWENFLPVDQCYKIKGSDIPDYFHREYLTKLAVQCAEMLNEVLCIIYVCITLGVIILVLVLGFLKRYQAQWITVQHWIRTIRLYRSWQTDNNKKEGEVRICEHSELLNCAMFQCRQWNVGYLLMLSKRNIKKNFNFYSCTKSHLIIHVYFD